MCFHAFKHYFGLRGIKGGKLPYPKNNWLLSICLAQKQLRAFKFSMEWHNITGVSLRIILLSWLPLPNYYKKQRLLIAQQSAKRHAK
jgi:hypothetical protein